MTTNPGTRVLTPDELKTYQVILEQNGGDEWGALYQTIGNPADPRWKQLLEALAASISSDEHDCETCLIRQVCANSHLVDYAVADSSNAEGQLMIVLSHHHNPIVAQILSSASVHEDPCAGMGVEPGIRDMLDWMMAEEDPRPRRPSVDPVDRLATMGAATVETAILELLVGPEEVHSFCDLLLARSLSRHATLTAQDYLEILGQVWEDEDTRWDVLFANLEKECDGCPVEPFCLGLRAWQDAQKALEARHRETHSPYPSYSGQNATQMIIKAVVERAMLTTEKPGEELTSSEVERIARNSTLNLFLMLTRWMRSTLSDVRERDRKHGRLPATRQDLEEVAIVERKVLVEEIDNAACHTTARVIASVASQHEDTRYQLEKALDRKLRASEEEIKDFVFTTALVMSIMIPVLTITIWIWVPLVVLGAFLYFGIWRFALNWLYLGLVWRWPRELAYRILGYHRFTRTRIGSWIRLQDLTWYIASRNRDEPGTIPYRFVAHPVRVALATWPLVVLAILSMPIWLPIYLIVRWMISTWQRITNAVRDWWTTLHRDWDVEGTWAYWIHEGVGLFAGILILGFILVIGIIWIPVSKLVCYGILALVRAYGWVRTNIFNRQVWRTRWEKLQETLGQTDS